MIRWHNNYLHFNVEKIFQVCDQLESCMSVSDDALVSEAANLTDAQVTSFIDNHVNSAVALSKYKEIINTFPNGFLIM